MKALLVAVMVLVLGPMLPGRTQTRRIHVEQSPFAVTPSDSAKLWLTVECAAVEGASPAGCLFILPPPKVIFYDYPETSEVCTAETAGDIGIRCVPFGVLKTWIKEVTTPTR